MVAINALARAYSGKVTGSMQTNLAIQRVRGVPLPSEALSLGDLGGSHLACNSVAIPDPELAGQSE